MNYSYKHSYKLWPEPESMTPWLAPLSVLPQICINIVGRAHCAQTCEVQIRMTR